MAKVKGIEETQFGITLQTMQQEQLKVILRIHAKNTKTENSAFFDSLKEIQEIVVIGHSLSPVDHPYFRKTIEENTMPDKLYWKISWYSDPDKDRIRKFDTMMGIDEQNVEI